MNFYRFAVSFIKPISKIFFPYEIIGDINSVPENEGLLICANHISYLDAVFLAISLKREIRFVAKKKYADSFLLKPVFKKIGSFGIDPDKPDLTAIKNCFKVIKNGEILGIFPEGTRIIKGRTSTPMPGAAMIAHKTKAPIFYLRIKPIKGTFKLFKKTYLYVGGLITPEELGVTDGKGDNYKKASEKLIDLIYSLGE